MSYTYKEMLDEQISEQLRASRERREEAGKTFNSSPTLAPADQFRRLGGGGEPLRRADGSIITNLRTVERTANPNLPFDRNLYSLPLPSDEIQQGLQQAPPRKTWPDNGFKSDVMPRMGQNRQEKGQGEEAQARTLFSHTYDSPEEKESLFLKRQRQRELRAVLEAQIVEKEERRQRQSQKKQEEERLEVEHERSLEFSVNPSDATAAVITLSTSSPKGGSSPLKVTHDDDDAGALGQLLNSPIRPRLNSDEASLSDRENDFELVKEEHMEQQEILLRRIRDQGAEIEKLTQQLQGIQEGRELFTATSIMPRSPNSLIPVLSPIKKYSQRGVPRNDQQLFLQDSSELKSSSQYYPLGNSPSLVTSNSLSIGDVTPLQDKNTIVSSTMLQSSFGLTPFEKSFNSNQYENRKEEALECFLRAFQNGTC